MPELQTYSHFSPNFPLPVTRQFPLNTACTHSAVQCCAVIVTVFVSFVQHRSVYLLFEQISLAFETDVTLSVFTYKSIANFYFQEYNKIVVLGQGPSWKFWKCLIVTVVLTVCWIIWTQNYKFVMMVANNAAATSKQKSNMWIYCFSQMQTWISRRQHGATVASTSVLWSLPRTFQGTVKTTQS